MQSIRGLKKHVAQRLYQRFNIKKSPGLASCYIENLIVRYGYSSIKVPGHTEQRKCYVVRIKDYPAVVVYDHGMNCPVTVWKLN